MSSDGRLGYTFGAFCGCYCISMTRFDSDRSKMISGWLTFADALAIFVLTPDWSLALSSYFLLRRPRQAT